jgi:hypothetical protein
MGETRRYLSLPQSGATLYMIIGLVIVKERLTRSVSWFT